jgi:putative transposase
MWSPSYYVGTAGQVSADVIEKYIQAEQTKWCDSSTG